MTKNFKLTLLFLFSTLAGLQAQNQYRCMIQMNAYKGEAAYVAISLINSKNKYEQTLAVLGADKSWYSSLTEWFKAQKQKQESLDALVGASIKGGDRRIITFKLDDKYLNKGYKIRFESVVEDQKYAANDIEIPFGNEINSIKTEGKAYIKTVKINKIQ